MGKILMRVLLHIREIAEQRGISRSRLARRADLNYNTVKDLWEDEVKDVQFSTLAKLARVLKVSITDLATPVFDESDEL